jgi:hypothetical protein
MKTKLTVALALRVGASVQSRAENVYGDLLLASSRERPLLALQPGFIRTAAFLYAIGQRRPSS